MGRCRRSLSKQVNDMVLTTQALSKSYGSTRALSSVDLKIPSGSVYGILGPNGSGKTTLLSTVLDILKPTSGTFQWFDQLSTPLAESRRRLGTLLETPNYYPYLNGSQNLAVTASIRDCDSHSIRGLLQRVGLGDQEKVPFKNYSLGMKQRLALAGCLVGDPDVLVLDEPTNGLDPSGIADIRALIQDLHKGGKTIILASHMLDEVEKVCTHVAILKRGKLLESGTMEQVLLNDRVIDVDCEDRSALKKALQAYEPKLQLVEHDPGFRLSGEIEPGELNRYCFEQGLTLSMLHVQSRNLEGRFLELTDD